MLIQIIYLNVDSAIQVRSYHNIDISAPALIFESLLFFFLWYKWWGLIKKK